MSKKAKNRSICLIKIARVKASRVLKAPLGTMAQKSAYAKVLGSWKKFLDTLSIGFVPPGWFNAFLKKQGLQKTSWIISSFKKFIQVVSTQGWASKASREKPVFKKGSFGSPLSSLAAIRHCVSSVRSLLWIGLIYFGVLWGLCFFANTAFFERHCGFRFLGAYLNVMIGESEVLDLIFSPDKWVEISALDFIQHPFMQNCFEACITALKRAALQALLLTLLFLALLGICVYRNRQGQVPSFTAQMPRHVEDGVQDLEPSHTAWVCKSTSLALLESLETQPLSDTDTVEHYLDQIPIHPQRSRSFEREEPSCVCCDDPEDQVPSHPASAASSKLYQVEGKAAAFKALEDFIMTAEKEDRA